MINATHPKLAPKKKVLDKRIPTVVGLLILVVALIVGTLFMGSGLGVFAPRATPATTPTRIKVTNVTDTGFSVSFVTDEKTAGFVKYGTDPQTLKTQSGDDRDQLSGTVGSYTTHQVSVRGLEQNTAYSFVLGTGSGSTFDNNGTPFTVKTAKRSGAPSAAKTIYGSVTDQNGAPADGALVYVTIEGAGEMSSLVKSSGSWAVPLSNARTRDGSGYAGITDDTPVTITIQGVNEDQTQTITTTVRQAQPAAAVAFGAQGALGKVATTGAGEDRGLEDSISDSEKTASGSGSTTGLSEMLEESKKADDTKSSATQSATGGTLGQQLGQQLAQATQPSPSPSPTVSPQPSPSPSVSPSPAVSPTPTPTTTPTPSPTVTTVDLNGSSTGQKVETTQPIIVGKAAPNVTITITIHSTSQITQNVTTGGNGNFALDLEALGKSLEPGDHTANYSYTDPSTGQVVTGQIAFVVQAAEPYGSGKPYVAPSPSPSPSPSQSPATGSATASTSGRVSIPSTESGIPTSGSVGTTWALVIGGLFFLIAGIWSHWIANQLKETEISA